MGDRKHGHGNFARNYICCLDYKVQNAYVLPIIPNVLIYSCHDEHYRRL